MAQSKNWTTTTFEVKVKHRRNKQGEPISYERRYMAGDIKAALLDNDGIKAVSAKVRRSEWRSPSKLPRDNQDVLILWPDGVVLRGKYFSPVGGGMLTGFACWSEKMRCYAGKVGYVGWKPYTAKLAGE